MRCDVLSANFAHRVWQNKGKVWGHLVPEPGKLTEEFGRFCAFSKWNADAAGHVQIQARRVARITQFCH
jgi:hypothetical protein